MGWVESCWGTVVVSGPADSHQMMRGAEMLFAAMFAVTALRRVLNRYDLLGVLCCVVGGVGQGLGRDRGWGGVIRFSLRGASLVSVFIPWKVG